MRESRKRESRKQESRKQESGKQESGKQESRKAESRNTSGQVDECTRSANFHATINIIKPKKHYFCEVTMNAMKNDCLTPNFKPQTYYAGFHLSFVIRNFSFVISSQRTTGWDAMFTFSGKERDQETGYSYFGARYYDSDLSIWLSVDPLASKYPSLSPYVYCANNPVKLVDPDGREIWITGENESILYTPGMKYEGSDEFTAKAVSALNTMHGTEEGKGTLNELTSSSNTFNIEKGNTSSFREDSEEAFIGGKGSGGTIKWNPAGAELPVNSKSGKGISPITDLGHELFHGLDANRGLLDDKLEHGIKRSEWQAVYRENNLRSQMNLPLRTHYNVERLGSINGPLIRGLPPFMLSLSIKNTLPNLNPRCPSWYKP